ncbi:MAG: response regulator [Candidatus Omnitrophica bacterium]|nr:response regulator [Candidatus Omnitrophota bacterium]
MAKKILYIEDEEHMAVVVKARLEGNGYECSLAADGKEGIEKAKAEIPDLILLDIFLPKVDGFKVAQTLREDPATKKIPIIAISASGVDYLEDQCRNVGIEDVLRKPYETEDLLEKIKERLK